MMHNAESLNPDLKKIIGDFQLRTVSLKIAVVHDWIFVRRGGERVLEEILTLVPKADVFYLFGSPETVLQHGGQHRFFPSFLAKVPLIKHFYKVFLPLFPVAIESFDLSSYDLILSSSSCVAKGIICSPLAIHISYTHSPMRYVWDQEHRYFTNKPSFMRPVELLRRIFLSRLRIWDVTASHRCDVLLANSTFVARRCAVYFGRLSKVVFPPVNIERFSKVSRRSVSSKKVLLFGAWVPYKGMAEALDFCVKNNIEIVAAGQGKALKHVAKKYRNHPGVEIVESPTEDEVTKLFSRCHALLLPGVEDFGIVPVEAQAAGMWVVAPRQGGTGESVVNLVTGFHFEAGDPVSMLSALHKALATDTTAADIENMRNHARSFSRENFFRGYTEHVVAALQKTREGAF